MRQSSLDGLTGRSLTNTPKPRPSSSETNLRKLAGGEAMARPGSALGLLQGNIGLLLLATTKIRYKRILGTYEIINYNGIVNLQPKKHTITNSYCFLQSHKHLMFSCTQKYI